MDPKKLEASGIRSINNVVDIGNLVMLEMGQPIHIFDYDAIEGKQLFVTSHTPYLELETLDELIRPIPPAVLLICDEKKPLSFAGVMGGKSSAVSLKTRNILIEAAYFTPQAIRKTTKLTGLRTDSSSRFEKGTDPNAIIPTLQYTLSLIQEIAGGETSGGIVDEKVRSFERKKINCRISKINELLGTRLSCGEVVEIFQRLGIIIESEEHNLLVVSVPTYRNDLSNEIDLIEETARIYGYNNIPKKCPQASLSTLLHAPIYLLEKNVRARLIGEGLQEFLTCDLISPQQAEMCLENSLPKETLISVLAPSSIDQSVLRISLLPGLLQVVKHNIDHKRENISGFEIGKIHFREKETFKEFSNAAIILTGLNAPYHFDPKPKEVDFFDLKGIVENLLSGLKLPPITWIPSHLHNFHPGRQAQIKIGNSTIGALGEVHPDLITQIDIGKRVYFAEINLHDLFPLLPKQQTLLDLPLYPGSERDWTITLKEEVPIDSLLSLIRSNTSSFLESVYLLDLYKSEQIGKDKKNATFRFFYRDQNQTIAFETVEKEHARLIETVAKHINSLS
jgi:phenylalanyl-tRNA synthetase beta chain